jgi:hypothetical protein
MTAIERQANGWRSMAVVDLQVQTGIKVDFSASCFNKLNVVNRALKQSHFRGLGGGRVELPGEVDYGEK